MPAPLSIILPTLDAAENLGPTLAALTEGLGAGLIAEVIFADGGSKDDTRSIAEDVGAKFIVSPRGRGPQMAKGANHARADWLLFLHSDSILQPGWTKAVQAHLTKPESAGFFRLTFDDTTLPARIVGQWANFRARMYDLPYGDQGLLISRKLYESIGGFSDIPLMEDVDIARRLRNKLRALPAGVTTSAAKYRRDGWIRRSFANALLLARYRLGADPADLARRYYRDSEN